MFSEIMMGSCLAGIAVTCVLYIRYWILTTKRDENWRERI